jgi:hypothetical protein
LGEVCFLQSWHETRDIVSKCLSSRQFFSKKESRELLAHLDIILASPLLWEGKSSRRVPDRAALGFLMPWALCFEEGLWFGELRSGFSKWFWYLAGVEVCCGVSIDDFRDRPSLSCMFRLLLHRTRRLVGM